MRQISITSADVAWLAVVEPTLLTQAERHRIRRLREAALDVHVRARCDQLLGGRP